MIIRCSSRFLFFISVLFIFFLPACKKKLAYPNEFRSSWNETVKRHWIGPEYWANRLQDWQLNKGRMECIGGNAAMRTVHLLSHSIVNDSGYLAMEIVIGRIDTTAITDKDAFAGFLLGAGNPSDDYRKRALVHQASGNGGGIIAAINGDGSIVFLNNENVDEKIPISAAKENKRPKIQNKRVKLLLEITAHPANLKLSVYDEKTGEKLSEATTNKIDTDVLKGNIALIANGGADTSGASFWFSKWHVWGTMCGVNEKQLFGPVLGVQYTLSNKILKLTAQMPPVSSADEQGIRFEIMDRDSTWKNVGLATIEIPSYTATFRIENWNDSVSYRYRLVYGFANNEQLKTYYYEGILAQNPEKKDEIVVAGFTGNSNSHGTIGSKFDFNKLMWFPHADITRSVAYHKPDLLVFTGDQVYEGRPTAPDKSSFNNSMLDYLYKWYLWCWAYDSLTRNIPCITLPDDHDVYHGNLWGADGIKARPPRNEGEAPDYYKGFEAHWSQDGGGYVMPAEFVNMVQRTQTSHLPDPYDPTPVQQGIGVYYTSVSYGGISIAIIEDRKFKSAPSMVLLDKNVVNGFSLIKDIKPNDLDNRAAKLLGDRQMEFLEKWTADWQDADMKMVVSQTIFANLSTYPDSFITDEGATQLANLPRNEIPTGYSPAKDMDSNGWPPTGRNEALKVIRKGYAFMLAGDQHLGSVIHHGINDWDDAGWSFCVPSIANLWPRRWFPQQPGKGYVKGMPPYTGKYLDGFENHITVWAVSNPAISNKQPAELHDRAPGYGIVKLKKSDKTITMECWSRYENPATGKQYPGWPITISMYDNYAAKSRYALPLIRTQGLDKPPVIQIINEKRKEIVYTVRANAFNYRPKVFEKGLYTVRIGEPGTSKLQTITNLQSILDSDKKEIILKF